MIKYLKFLWKKCFGSVGYSRTKTEVVAVKHTPTAIPVLVIRRTHCGTHTRFKKSCSACAEAVK
jgi:hypothetical protein